MWYVYILNCKNETIYVGYTYNLDARLDRHRLGTVKSTKDRRPVELHCYFCFPNKYLAYNFEKYLKSGSGRAFTKRHFLEKTEQHRIK